MTSRLSEDGKTVIVLPGTKKLRDFEYTGNTKIERVVCTEDMEEIGAYFFSGCTSLRSIELKPGLKKIGCETFRGCTQLTHVSFVDGMEEIGRESFYYCTSLTSIEFKPGLKRIGTDTFDGCHQLTTIIMSLPCSDYQQLFGQIRKAGARHLKNLIVSRPLTCPETLTFDFSSSTDDCAKEIVEIHEREYNIMQSLSIVMLMLRGNLGAPCFWKCRMRILVYWFRGNREFPLDTRALRLAHKERNTLMRGSPLGRYDLPQ